MRKGGPVVVVVWVLLLLIVGLVGALSGQVPEDFAATFTVEQENTKPTNNIVFFLLKGPGITCSADANTPFAKTLTALDGKRAQMTLRAEPERLKR